MKKNCAFFFKPQRKLSMEKTNIHNRFGKIFINLKVVKEFKIPL